MDRSISVPEKLDLKSLLEDLKEKEIYVKVGLVSDKPVFGKIVEVGDKTIKLQLEGISEVQTINYVDKHVAPGYAVPQRHKNRPKRS